MFAIAEVAAGFGEESRGPLPCDLCGKPNATYVREIPVLTEETYENGDGNETTRQVTQKKTAHLCADCAFKTDKDSEFRSALKRNPFFWIGFPCMLLAFTLIILIAIKYPVPYRNVLVVVAAVGIAMFAASIFRARTKANEWASEHEYEYVSYAGDSTEHTS